MKRSRHPAVTLAVLAAAVLALPAFAQPAAPPSIAVDRDAFLKNAIRIDRSKVKTSVEIVAELPASGGDSAALTMPTANVVMDAWTRQPLTESIGEDYDFTTGDDVTFSILVKIGQPGAPGGIGIDYFLVTCGTEEIPPLPDTVVLVDDVEFGPIAAGVVRLVVLTVTLSDLDALFPAGTTADWFAAVDFDLSNNSDLDGDTFVDFAVEAAPARFIDLALPSVDEIGAGLIEFFNPGPGAIQVFAPHLPNPASKAIGAQPGEAGETRPWCFGFR